MKTLVLLLLLGALPAQKPLKSGTYAHFETSLGTFTAELETKLAPKTVANFIALVDGTKTGKPFYDGLIFHRVVDAYLIQSGDPTGTGKGGPGYTIPDEFSSALRHDRAGVLSMGNSGQPNSGGSQFFVTLQAMSDLNKVHSAFGSVIRGMDVVRKISSVRTRNERPVTPVILQKVRIEVVP